MINKAFNPSTGLLADKELTETERKRMHELFTGAFGSFRNPVMHRSVDYDNSLIALSLILLANTLLNIVEKRREEYYLKKIESEQAIRP